MDNIGVERILEVYGYEPVRFIGMQKGYRNESHGAVLADGQQVNLIIYKREPGIAERILRTNHTGNYVAAHGLPARHTLDQRVVRLRAGERVRYASLYAYLPGETIPWEAYTKAHIKALGGMLSKLHTVLATMPEYPLPLITDEYLAIMQRVRRYLSELPVREAIQAKLGVAVDPARYTYYETVLQLCAQLPGQQALHMDFVRGNILFTTDSSGEPAITGILDFEKTAYGHPLFDIARTLAFLLVDCKYKTAGDIHNYFLRSGYAKRGATKLPTITIKDVLNSDISILDTLTDMFLLYDWYKFLRHNPYESLAQNEHYVRTKHILINRNIIQPL